jgi:hypothetical protein
MDAVSRLSSAIIPKAVKSTRLFRLARLARHMLASHGAVYDQEYYDTIVESEAARSADVRACPRK